MELEFNCLTSGCKFKKVVVDWPDIDNGDGTFDLHSTVRGESVLIQHHYQTRPSGSLDVFASGHSMFEAQTGQGRMKVEVSGESATVNSKAGSIHDIKKT